MKKLLLTCFVLTLFGVHSKAQFLTATIDGITDAGYSTGANDWALGWDNSFLYIRKNTNGNEPVIIYMDINPIVPVSGGVNANGNLTGVTHWGITPTLPFRGDFTIYWEDSYLQYQTADGSGGWNAPIAIGTPERTNGISNKECRISWSAIRGIASPPAAFNWFGYCNSRPNSGTGFIFHPTPVAANPTDIQPFPRFFYYNSIVNTTNLSPTNPFALNQISFETRGNYDYTESAYSEDILWDMTINAESGIHYLSIDKNMEIRNRLDIASPFSNLRPIGLGANVVRLTLSGNQGSVRLSGGVTFGEFGGNIMELEITGNITLFSSGNFVDFRNFIISTTGDLTANDVQMSSNSGSGSFTLNGVLRTTREQGLFGVNDFTIRSNNLSLIIGPSSRVVYNYAGSQTVTTSHNYANLEIAGTGIKTLNGNGTVNNNLILTNGSLHLMTNNLSVANGVSGPGFLAATTSSNLSLSGGISTLRFAGGRNIIKDFSMSGTADVSLVAMLGITGGSTPGTVTVSGSAQLKTGGHLVLKSNANGTARVAPVTSSATLPISGEVTVERFIPQAPVALGPPVRNGRGWRLLSFPVTGTSTIWQAWGNGAASRVSSLSTDPPINIPNPVQTPGTGTLITGHAYETAAAANAAGYDWWPALWVPSNPAGHRGAQTSISRFAANTNSGNGTWQSNIASRSTAATTLTSADPAYMLFVRGDRTVAVGGGSTTLAPKGNLRVGIVTTTVPPEAPTARFFTYGNPYASTLDFAALYDDASNSGLLKEIMHVWDANLSGNNGLGGYRSVTRVSGVWVDNLNGAAANMQFIQSGQGVLLESDAASGGNLTTRETHKVSGNREISPFAAVTPGSRPMLYSRLYMSNHSGDINVVDGAVAGFNADYKVSNDDAFDHSKPLSITGNLALGYTQGGSLLSFEGRPLIQDGDILYLQSNGLTATAYTIEFEAKDLAAPGRKAFLKDKFLSTETEIPLTGEKFRYGFEGVSGQEASTSADRFEVVFKVTETKWILLTGRAQRPNILLDWKVPSASLFKSYIVEQSANNTNYRRVTTLQADQNAGNEISHVMNVGGGTKFFRVRGITHSGETIISNEILIGMNDGTAQLSVSPNPATSGSTVSLLIENLEKANYNTTLLNANGAPVTNMVIRHDGRNQVYQFQLPANLAPGTYYLQVRGKAGNIVKSILIR